MLLNFTVAFDKVNYNVTHCLSDLGVCRVVHEWFSLFHLGLGQRVVLEERVSTRYLLTCGIPQTEFLFLL